METAEYFRAINAVTTGNVGKIIIVQMVKVRQFYLFSILYLVTSL